MLSFLLQQWILTGIKKSLHKKLHKQNKSQNNEFILCTQFVTHHKWNIESESQSSHSQCFTSLHGESFNAYKNACNFNAIAIFMLKLHTNILYKHDFFKSENVFSVLFICFLSQTIFFGILSTYL
jgi:hypothetical protein